MASTSDWDCTFDDANFDRITLPEIDGALLMELLEEPFVEDAEDDRLGCVIRSLEAELGHAGPSAGGGGCGSVDGLIDCEDCGLEDLMFDLDEHSCSRSTADLAEDRFDWVGMEEMVDSPIEEMGRWYVGSCGVEDGMAGFGDPRDYDAICYGESSTEQLYMPLWQ